MSAVGFAGGLAAAAPAARSRPADRRAAVRRRRAWPSLAMMPPTAIAALLDDRLHLGSTSG